MKPLLKLLGAAVVCIAGLFFLGMGGLWFIFTSSATVTIGKYDLGKGIEVKLFIESEGWDPLVETLHYRVKKDGRELVPTTVLGHHHGNDPVEMASFRTDDGSLVGLHRTPTTSSDCLVFIMIDVESGESWPRLGDDESSSDPAVIAKWRRRYSRLKARNRDLPCATYFETPNKSLEVTAPSAAPQL